MRNEILGNRYRVLERIGEGGMAYVYVAMDEKLGRKVAIKVLHEHMEKNPDIRQRFQLEAQAVSSLDHPNVVKIYDFSGAQSERLWIVTEVIHGKNLAQYVQQFTGGWLHPLIATCVVREILKALDAAHAQGIVHRDIKPENVMMTVEGRVKLMDFGIAKDTGKASMTLTGTFMGSPSYMSPEQIRGRDVDLRSDLYSLSVLFYEVTTGRLPFTGQTTHDVVLKIMEGEFTHPRFLVPSLPDPLNDMIITGMTKEAVRRFQTARSYAAAIDAFLSGAGFDESHIELERYFKDRRAYEERLRKTGIGSAGDARITRRPSATTRGTQAHPQPQLPMQTKRLDPATRATQHVPPPPTPAAQGRQTVRIPTPPPFVPDATWQKHLAAQPAADRQARQTQHGLPMAASTNAVASPAQAIDAQARQRAALNHQRRLQHRRSAGRGMHRSPRSSEPRQSFLGQAFGVLLVGLIGLVSLWGFWELQSRLAGANRPSRSATVTGQEKKVPQKKTKPRDGTPSVVKIITKKPASPPPSRPEPSNGGVKRPAVTTTSPNKRPLTKRPPAKRRDTRATATIVQTLPAPASSDPNLAIEAAEVRKVKVTDKASDESAAVTAPAPANDESEEASSSIAASPASSPAPAASEETAPEPKKIARGKIAFSSDPAAEVYVNGKRYGTTIDGTTSSGFLTLPAGRHTLELRRQGYRTHRVRFDLEGGAQIQHPRIALEPVGQADGNSKINNTALTLRVSAFPAQVTIKNVENGTTQAFTMQAATRVVQLESGRYSVRIEHKGDAKERELNLTGGRLTFTAEFKDE